jgi:Tfp pilus assembly protein PilN
MLKKGHLIYGVDIRLDGAGYSVRAVAIAHTKDDITLTESLSFNTIADLLKHTGLKTPLNISITGEGILTKATADFTKETSLEQVLPGIKTDDIYASIYALEQQHILAVIKKKRLDTLLQELAQSHVVGVYMGPLLILNLKTYLNFNQTAYDGYTLQESERLWQVSYLKISQNQGLIAVNTETIQENYLIAYATALEFYVKQYPLANALSHIPLLTNNKSKNLNITLIILGAVFILLLGNFIAFSTLNEKSQTANQTLSFKTALLAKNDSLFTQQKNKAKVLAAVSQKDNNLMDFYLDRIASSMPHNITWSALQCYPMEVKKGKEAITTFKTNTVLIEGHCDNALTLNQWLLNLKQIPWIKEVEIEKFNKLDNALPVFTLNITLKKI